MDQSKNPYIQRQLLQSYIRSDKSHQKHRFSSHGHKISPNHISFAPKILKLKEQIQGGVKNLNFIIHHPQSLQEKLQYNSIKKEEINKNHQFHANNFLKVQPNYQPFPYLGYLQQENRHNRGREQINNMNFENKYSNTTSANDIEFTFPDPYVRYKIIPVGGSHMSLDVAQDNSENFKKGQLIIWNHYGGPHQLFYIKSNGSKYFNFISSSTGFYMEVENIKSEEYQSRAKQKIVFRPKNEKESQKFKIRNFKKGVYYIESYYGEVLDVQQQQMKNGTPIILWDLKKENNRNQLWKINPN